VYFSDVATDEDHTQTSNRDGAASAASSGVAAGPVFQAPVPAAVQSQAPAPAPFQVPAANIMRTELTALRLGAAHTSHGRVTFTDSEDVRDHHQVIILTASFFLAPAALLLAWVWHQQGALLFAWVCLMSIPV